MTETITINGEKSDIEVSPVTLLLHKDIMNIKAPDRFEINPVNTFEEILSLNQEKWAHISTGEIFQYLFRLVFPLPENSFHKTGIIDIPEKLEDLLTSDLGIQHISGLIILAMTKGGIQGKELFFKLPEAYLYPSYQANLADLFIVLPKIIEGMQNLDEKGGIKPKPKRKNPLIDWIDTK